MDGALLPTLQPHTSPNPLWNTAWFDSMLGSNLKIMANINSFEVLKKMGENNMDIHLSPLVNIIQINKSKQGYHVTIGVSDNIGFRLSNGEQFNGGLLLANSKQFKEIEDILKEEELKRQNSNIS